jgi:hypothetical protein
VACEEEFIRLDLTRSDARGIMRIKYNGRLGENACLNHNTVYDEVRLLCIGKLGTDANQVF